MLISWLIKGSKVKFFLLNIIINNKIKQCLIKNFSLLPFISWLNKCKYKKFCCLCKFPIIEAYFSLNCFGSIWSAARPPMPWGELARCVKWPMSLFFSPLRGLLSSLERPSPSTVAAMPCALVNTLIINTKIGFLNPSTECMNLWYLFKTCYENII